MENSSSIIAERRAEFHDLFGGEEFLENSVIEATQQLWQVVGILYGEKAADRAFDHLVGACFPHAVREYGWRQALEEEANGIYSDTPAGTLLHDLTAYADYGIFVGLSRTVEERELIIGKQVEDGLALLLLIASTLEDAKTSPVWRIVTKAHARWKIDLGLPVNRDDLVVLSGLAEQSVRNRLSGKDREIHGTSDHVEADEALKWLKNQKKFVRSLWRYQDDSEAIEKLETAVRQPVFVPVAHDRTLFHPGLKKDGFYLVGDSGSEREFDDFDEALRALQEMLIPAWRRPTEKGRWTQVRGIDWRRVDWDQLGGDTPLTII
jgi:hypothetical protein